MKHEEVITQKIISAIENGQATHTMPWHSVRFPVNAQNARPYQGINSLILWAQSLEAGYSSPNWASFITWKGLGRQIKKGSKGTRITYWHFYSPEEKEKLAPHSKSSIGFRKFYIVFNEAQLVESEGGETERIEMPDATHENGSHATDVVLEIVDSAGAELTIEGDRAYYHREMDCIYMPTQNLFFDTHFRNREIGFASVLAHELVHWTGHVDRLDRKMAHKGTSEYAFEELVAELGSAFICSELDIAYSGIPENAGYINSWLKSLRDDPKAIFKASGLAMKAKRYLVPETQEEDNSLVA